MISVDEARSIILQSAAVLSLVKHASAEAAGFVLAEDIVSTEAIPPFDNSAMDGYAVRSEDVQNASHDQPVILKVIDEVQAGTTSHHTVGSNEAVQIMTGAPLPPGADAVVMVEHTEKLDSGSVKVFLSVAKHEHCRFAGDDIQKGQLVFEKGRRLKSYDTGVLASIGRKEVMVWRKPRVAIVSTGNELIGVDEPLTSGKIRSSNNVALQSLLLHHGVIPFDLGIARDTPEDTERQLTRAIEYDVILTSGGVSMGEYDFVRETFQRLGIEIKFWKVRQKPGKPLVFGTKGSQLFFGLPGNPVSSIVCFELYVVPALYKMMGLNYSPLIIHARCKHGINKKPGLRHFLRAKISKSEKGFEVELTGNQSSGVLSSLSYADGLIDLAESRDNVNEGETVEVVVLDKEKLLKLMSLSTD
ncbi:molybdopterin molybdotransferase MoeA [bacterium]|nr:molybdopterin molybdotransferase MoeA [bacterium]